MRADARRNYDRLLTEAGAAFAEKGTEASLEDIARSAGVGVGTLYRHFPTRQDLILAVLRDGFEAMATFARELDVDDPGLALRQWLLAQLRHITTTRGLTAELAVAINNPESPLWGSCEVIFSVGTELLGRAQKAGVVRADLTQADVSSVVQGIAWSCESDPVRQERLLDLFLEGVLL
ncbi:TetR/AcrR family transcriptional regulator [Herbidospora mongoliensis]|uniref:TetR/AcrR family transcriptional regulator n=1 Tax=Herbidospora mongoliensis TaxID=688067 RepID=UPI0009FC0608|nr:TetR/AcrR family transcriptional regulator [Herbidospora mongoliensis]